MELESVSLKSDRVTHSSTFQTIMSPLSRKREKMTNFDNVVADVQMYDVCYLEQNPFPVTFIIVHRHAFIKIERKRERKKSFL